MGQDHYGSTLCEMGWGRSYNITTFFNMGQDIIEGDRLILALYLVNIVTIPWVVTFLFPQVGSVHWY